MRVCPQNGQKLNGCVSTGLPAPEFVEDRNYLVVRFTRPVKTEGCLDDAELVLSMIRKDPEIRQMEIVGATGMSLSKVKRIIADFRDSGRMARIGSNRNGRCVVKTDWCHWFGIGVSVDTDHDTNPKPRMPDMHPTSHVSERFISVGRILDSHNRLSAGWAEVERLRVRNLAMAEGTGHDRSNHPMDLTGSD